jgi:hypothetical protein
MNTKNRMKIIDLFLVSIYLHFCKMRDKGRKIVPWFQTLSSISLFFAITVIFFVKLFLGTRLNSQTAPEGLFILGFLFIGAICFFSIKNYFFKNERYIKLSEFYLETYSERQRKYIKIRSITFVMILPIILGFIIWYNATH